MVSTIETRTDVAHALPTPCTVSDPVAARIAEVERDRHQRLLKRAQDMRLMVDPDYCRPTGCIVWEPTMQGTCELVSVDGCSCREFRLWGNCPHHAAVIEALTLRKDR